MAEAPVAKQPKADTPRANPKSAAGFNFVPPPVSFVSRHSRKAGFATKTASPNGVETTAANLADQPYGAIFCEKIQVVAPATV